MGARDALLAQTGQLLDLLDLEDPLRMWGNYANKREEFYQSIGSDIRQVSYE